VSSPEIATPFGKLTARNDKRGTRGERIIMSFVVDYSNKCHSESFASCHAEGEKRPKNLAQDELREESERDSSPVGLRMTSRVAKQSQTGTKQRNFDEKQGL
jgi:hypothetical protein